MNQITVTGMVIAVAPMGEYDRRVVLLTRERGKLSVFARGARKPNSMLVGVTSPFTFGTFVLFEGRTSYTMMSASVSNYFEELRMDVEGAYYGFYFLEFANYYAREGNDETELLKLLYQTFRALTNAKIPNRLIRLIYELKIVTINGEGPQMFECIVCRKPLEKSEDIVFSVRKGGCVCAKCAGRMEGTGQIRDGRRLLSSSVYTLQYIVASPVEKLYTFVVKKEVQRELETVIAEYLEEYVGRRFKSLDILETITR